MCADYKVKNANLITQIQIQILKRISKVFLLASTHLPQLNVSSPYKQALWGNYLLRQKSV
jgi:hypothetical protein